MTESLFYFMAYSVCGWFLENVYSLATRGVFWKEGFMKGPYKPMYGFAPLLLLHFGREAPNPFLMLGLCFAVPTAVEYASGMLLQGLFGRQWWDYSNNRWQLQGHICLRFSLYWGCCPWGSSPISILSWKKYMKGCVRFGTRRVRCCCSCFWSIWPGQVRFGAGTGSKASFRGS